MEVKGKWFAKLNLIIFKANRQAQKKKKINREQHFQVNLFVFVFFIAFQKRVQENITTHCKYGKEGW